MSSVTRMISSTIGGLFGGDDEDESPAPAPTPTEATPVPKATAAAPTGAEAKALARKRYVARLRQKSSGGRVAATSRVGTILSDGAGNEPLGG